MSLARRCGRSLYGQAICGGRSSQGACFKALHDGCFNDNEGDARMVGVSPKQNSGMLHFSRTSMDFTPSPIFRRKLFVWFPCSVFFLEMPGSCRWSGWSRRREGMETVLKRDFPPVPMLAAPKIYRKNPKSKCMLSRKNNIQDPFISYFPPFLA